MRGERLVEKDEIRSRESGGGREGGREGDMR